MRALFALILVASVSWSAFWLWGAFSHKASINEWISNRQIAGWRIEIDEISLFGYPNRFDITLKNPKIYSSDLSFKWQGEFLQILRLSYNKNHTIVVFPEAHHIESGIFWFDLTSERLHASVVARENDEQRIIIEGTTLRIKNNVFDQTFDQAQIALLQIGPHFKFRLTLNHADKASADEWKSLTISADLISGIDVQNHEIPFFDLSSLVFANTTVLIDSISVLEKRSPTKFNELLVETGIVLVGDDSF